MTDFRHRKIPEVISTRRSKAQKDKHTHISARHLFPSLLYLPARHTLYQLAPTQRVKILQDGTESPLENALEVQAMTCINALPLDNLLDCLNYLFE